MFFVRVSDSGRSINNLLLLGVRPLRISRELAVVHLRQTKADTGRLMGADEMLISWIVLLSFIRVSGPAIDRLWNQALLFYYDC